MSARLAAVLLAGLLAAPAAAEIPIDSLALEMKPLDGRVLFRKDPYDKSSFPVTVRDPDDPTVLLHGRIEVKGSFTRQTGKKSVLIKLEDGKWRGQARLSLNGMGTDPSQMREWLSWELMRALGMVIPGTRYTRLSINGEDQGLFLRIDWIDPKMFERAGLGADGQLFHPLDSSYCGDLTPASLERRRNCWLKLSPRDGDFGPLRTLIDAIDAEPVDTFHELVDRLFDAESLVNWFAVNALVTQSDTYNKNYFLYWSAVTGKWRVVPFDYDLTFGRTYDPYRPFPFTILNDHLQYYYPLEIGQSNPLHYQAMKNAPFRARVLARVRELTEGAPDAARPWRGWFAPARMERRLDELRAALLPEIRRDPFAGRDEARLEDEVAALKFYAVARVAHLRQVALGPSDWVPDVAAARLAAGEPAELVDGWGYLLGRVHAPRAGGAARLEARRGWPELVPDGADRAACVQRSWLLSGPAGATADVTLAYLDEHSRAREVGAAVADERDLQLFAQDGSGWRWLPSTAAPLANTVTAPAVRLSAGPLRLVACVGQPASDSGAP